MAAQVHEAVAARVGAYSPSEERPLLTYAGLAGVWLAGLAGFTGLSAVLNKPIRRLEGGDILLLAGATFHLSRLITKDAILSFLRAPFTRYTSPGAPGEVNEEPRKENEVQHALGELLTCPFCFATWVAAGLTYSYSLFPAFTRLVASLFCIIGIADAFQLAYGTAHTKARE